MMMAIPDWLRRSFSLGLEIERKTNIIALAAFFLALGGVLFQIIAYFRGPVVHLFPPDQVVLRAQVYPPDNQKYMTLVARLAYVNTGQPGYNGTLRRETVRLRLDTRDYKWTWYRFLSTDAKGTELQRIDKGEAKPLPVSAGSSESHETEFVPRRVRCQPNQTGCDTNANFLDKEQLLAALEKQGQLHFMFMTEIYGERSVTATCTAMSMRVYGWR